MPKQVTAFLDRRTFLVVASYLATRVDGCVWFATNMPLLSTQSFLRPQHPLPSNFLSAPILL